VNDFGIDRIPPNDLEAESAVLGSILVDRAMFEAVAEVLTAGDFYAMMNGAIFEAITELVARGAPTDKVAVAQALRQAGMLDKIGGAGYLGSLMDTVQTTASAAYYAGIVREKAILRGIIAAGTKIQAAGYDGEGDVRGAVATAEQALSSVTRRGAVPTHLEDPREALRRIVSRIRSDEREQVILSPWKGINEKVGGFAAGELIVIPASPAVGKTGLGITLADYIAEVYGPVLFAAIEMGSEAIHRRRLAQRASVSARAQRLGEMTSEQRQRLYVAEQRLESQPLYVTGKEQRSVSALYRNARQIVRDRGRLSAVIIDHVLFLDEAKPVGRGTRNEALDGMYQRLIEFADTFACPVFALIHLNRTGIGERPTFDSLQKIRDGGNIEGHAHTAIFPYREDPIEKPNAGELVIVKSRDGDTGFVKMMFYGARALWCDCDERGFARPAWFEYDERDRVAPNASMELAAPLEPEPNDADLDEARMTFG
jgi:replicative DNA helicase